jgi:Base plate wedge protein 53
MALYNLTSPYYTTSLNGGYLDVINFRNIPSNKDDVLFELTKQYEHRPELLANDLYGDVNLWWVFAVRNKNIIQDPIFDMVAGIKIYLPQQTSLNKALGI